MLQTMVQTFTQRSSRVTLWLAIVIALFSTQCDSLSDDCRKTLTCGDAGAPVLGVQDCVWRLPDGGVWEDGPQRRADGMWVWPNGEPTAEQDFFCLRPNPDGSGTTDNCTNGVEPAVGGRITCEPPSLCNINTRNCVRCLTHADCGPGGVAEGTGGPSCHPTAGLCVQCLEHVDCGKGRFCKANANNPAENECVECVGDLDCPNPQVCNTETNECTLACTSTDECRGAKPVCDVQNRVCVECLEDQQCTGGTKCHPQKRECVQCTDTPECSSLGLVCDQEDGNCVECVENEQCGGDEPPRCDTVSNTCVACLEHSHCTSVSASRCNVATHQCAPCTADAQCEANAPVCRDGVCVRCVEDAQCGENGHCELQSGTCVECLSDADCPLADAARCELGVMSPNRFTCQACDPEDGSSSECAGKAGPFCRPADRTCVSCLNAADCVGNPAASLCSGAGTCAPCTLDDHCNLFPNQRACRQSTNGNSCVQCTNDGHCATVQGRPACKDTVDDGPAPLNTCVECTSNADCTNPGESKCVANECVPCQVNAECSHLAGRGVCDDGECVQCTGTSFQACASGANVCDSLTRTCTLLPVGSAGLCDACVSNAHCSANGSEICAMQLFAGNEVGFFCFPASSQGTCPLVPFSGAGSVTTIDGTTASICSLRATTCTAFDHFANRACTGADDCGEPGLNDGRCLDGTCTIPCTAGALDCSGGEATSCLAAVCQFGD